MSSSLLQRYTQSMHNNDDDNLPSNNHGWDAARIENHPWLYIGSLSAAESHIHQAQYNIKRILTVARNLPMAPVPDFIDEHCIVEIEDHPRANFLDDAAKKCKDFIDIAYHEYLDSNLEEEVKKKKKSNEGKKVTLGTSTSHTSTSRTTTTVTTDTTTTSTTPSDNVNTQHPPSLLVHCASGISRSSTAILVWLMNNTNNQGLVKLDDALKMVRKNRPLVNPNIGFMMQLQVLEKNNGNLEQAVAIWNSDMKTEIYEHVSCRRRIANDIHAQVDELEVEIQMYQSEHKQNQQQEEMKNITSAFQQEEQEEDDIHNESTSGNETRSSSIQSLLQKLHQISDVLDNECDENAQLYPGIPEDRVAKMIFKSARNKIERLFGLLSNAAN